MASTNNNDLSFKQWGTGKDVGEQTPLVPKSDVDVEAKDKGQRQMSNNVKGFIWGAINVVFTVAIVVANKAVMGTFKFQFPVALTWCHSIFTAVGMHMMCVSGMFEKKTVPLAKVMPIAAAYVGFIVFNNLSLKYNTVGFYQLMKICITPCILAIEAMFYNKLPSRAALMATAVLLGGITVATLSDEQVASNMLGVFVGVLATVTSAVYQIWAGTKQKDLQVNANQLVHQASPPGAVLLTLLVPMLENVGFHSPPPPESLLGFEYNLPAVGAIVISSVLGLLVTLTAFLTIGYTSALTYNIVGHVKTVLIMASGVIVFGDAIGPKKLAGLSVAMAGIAWYTTLPKSGPAPPVKVPSLPTSKDVGINDGK